MRKRFLVGLLGVAIGLPLLTAAAEGQTASEEGMPAGGVSAEEVVGDVPTEGGAGPARFVPDEVVVGTAGDYETRAVDAPNLAAAEAAATEIEAEEPAIDEAGPNYVYAPEFVPNDAQYPRQDWLATIRAPGAWDVSRGGGVTVGVVDTGWQANHPDLVNKNVADYDFVNNDAVAEGFDYHGTSVAGIASAQTNNGAGVSSIGFGATFTMAKACGPDGCLTSDIARSIDWLSRTRGVKIINLSFGAVFPDGQTDAVLGDAIRRAQGTGALVVASNGNDDINTDDHYPSCFAGVLGVGATNDRGTRLLGSNTGPCVDLVAPGEGVLTTTDANDLGISYGNVYGTSFAAPQVAGTAALLKAKTPSLTAAQLAGRLQNNAAEKGVAGRDDVYGHGLLSARCAVNPSSTGC